MCCGFLSSLEYNVGVRCHFSMLYIQSTWFTGTKYTLCQLYSFAFHDNNIMVINLTDLKCLVEAIVIIGYFLPSPLLRLISNLYLHEMVLCYLA